MKETDREKREKAREEGDEVKGDEEQEYSKRRDTGGRSDRTVIYILLLPP